MNNNYELKTAEYYEYAHNGNIIVHGKDYNGYNTHMTYVMYDSLADVKRTMRNYGVKNITHMKKLS